MSYMKRQPHHNHSERIRRVTAHDFGSFEENKALPKNKYFSFSSSEEDPLQVPVPSGAKQVEMAFHRVVMWLALQIAHHSSFTVNAFEGQLKNLCQFKVFLNPPILIEHLKSRQILLLEEDHETVHYQLLKLD